MDAAAITKLFINEMAMSRIMDRPMRASKVLNVIREWRKLHGHPLEDIDERIKKYKEKGD